MSKLKVGIAIVSFFLVTASVYFIGRGEIFSYSKSAGKKAIVVVLPSSSNPYWVDVRRGAEGAQVEVPDFRVEVKATTGDQDAKAQAFMLSDLAARADVAAVVLGPASKSEPVAALAQLARKNIRCVVIDTVLDENKLKEFGFKPDAFVGSDNLDGAAKAAQAIAAELKRRNKPQPHYVLVLEGDRVHQSAIDRAEGFYAEAKRLGMEVEGVRADWSRSKAQDLATSKFLAGRKPQAVFASNDDMAIGVVTGLKSLGVDKANWPVIVGFDYTEPAIRAIEAGEMLGSAKQDPVKMARIGVLLARQAATNDPALPTKPVSLEIEIHPLAK